MGVRPRVTVYNEISVDGRVVGFAGEPFRYYLRGFRWRSDAILMDQDPGFQQVFARLVTHYWANGCFLDDAPILFNMAALADIPAVLIHGRLDVSGPLDTAWDLHRRWPSSHLVVLDDAGHGGSDMTSAIVEALNGR